MQHPNEALYPTPRRHRQQRDDSSVVWPSDRHGAYAPHDTRPPSFRYGAPRHHHDEEYSFAESLLPDITTFGPGFQVGPHAGKGPKDYRRSNARIVEDVCDRLQQHGEVDATDVEVTCEDGVVTLSGTVEDRRSKRVAEACADSVSGVRDVMNQLRIDAHSASTGS